MLTALIIYFIVTQFRKLRKKRAEEGASESEECDLHDR